ncbi:Putative GNAT domain, acyl-CoA N-acyltransferase [Colletotrichum destructivum]|uniref:GNAT domain, acyl-CoA N-acyltransferase n=1 Tax=Colletotrichum destructivum TaxID=34406 RepID=A0AAX4ILJ7_9PEZI|nr:Putative GNAT domain, acyl-CoA N-acyltransferase [Colletotrichum destructivum]
MDSPKKTSTPGDITIRTHRPGDMGYITHRHGTIYCKEFGFSERFEAYVGKITSDFLLNYDPLMERCWLAERDGAFLGCIMLIKDREAPANARLRCFLVEEAARGSGLGTRLIKLCIDMAREIGYERIALSTDKLMATARRLYTSFGFELKATKEHEDWGERQVGEIWEMRLR